MCAMFYIFQPYAIYYKAKTMQTIKLTHLMYHSIHNERGKKEEKVTNVDSLAMVLFAFFLFILLLTLIVCYHLSADYVQSVCTLHVQNVRVHTLLTKKKKNNQQTFIHFVEHSNINNLLGAHA